MIGIPQQNATISPRPPIAASTGLRDAQIALRRKLAALGDKADDVEGHIDFDLSGNIRAEPKQRGMLPDGNPTALWLARLGIKVQ